MLTTEEDFVRCMFGTEVILIHTLLALQLALLYRQSRSLEDLQISESYFHFLIIIW